MSNRNKAEGELVPIEKKWNQIYKHSLLTVTSKILLENSFLLPKQGKALDLACGLGSNALFLAEQGLDTYAWDASSIALNKLHFFAFNKNLNIHTKQVIIEPNTLPKESFDVIIITRFLDRSLTNAIMESLKPEGLLFYQTYVREKLDPSGPKNPAYLLARNELLQLFQPLKVVVYRENSIIGNVECGERNEALFIGQKYDKKFSP
ncbi:MAG: methyltransferase domain-containing protein [Methylococcales bacterium]|nr:methyltransferase domain-containing protein [Methylococcales bacterium]